MFHKLQIVFLDKEVPIAYDKQHNKLYICYLQKLILY